MTDIAHRFMEIRKFLGVTQKEFADRLGVSPGSVQSYEYGKIPKGEVLQTLYDMGYDLNWLMSGHGQMLRDVAQDVALDRMLMWNVAYFLCKRADNGDDPEIYADSFMEIYDAMLRQSRKAKESATNDQDNIVDFTLRRLNGK